MRTLIFLILCVAMQGPTWAGGKKKTIYTYITTGWKEQDFFGTGMLLTVDKVRPSIILHVHKVDGELQDLIGIPNTTQHGDGASWPASATAPYDRLKILTRIDWSKPVKDRGYGDWFNNDEFWEESVKSYKDKSGNSLLTLKPEMNGEKGTRYRFTVLVEDNTPFWFKNIGGPKQYFPLEIVIFRITERTGGSSNSDLQAFEETGSKDELCVIKKGTDLAHENTPEEHRIKNGAYVFNFVVYHTFKLASNYFLTVSARDVEGNTRHLKVPIQTLPLEGIKLENKNVQTSRDK